MQALKDIFFHHSTFSRIALVPPQEMDFAQEPSLDSPPQQLSTEFVEEQKPTRNHKPILHFGVSRALGSRDYQEDEYTCIDNLSVGKGPSYFAIFDGHGSDLFSSHSSSNLHNTIFESESFKSGDYAQAIREGILKEDQILFEKYQGEGGGSTATVCIISEDKLYLGNVGDSRAVLAIDTDDGICAKRLSKDHKPDDKEEKARILKAGGVVWKGRVRSEDCAINMSRAIGDFAHKSPLNHSSEDWIASEPYITEPVELTPAVKFVVLASDGLWDVASDEKVVQLIYAQHRNGLSPNDIAAHLTSFCANTPLADNCTVIVVFFDFHETRVFKEDDAGKVLISQHQAS